MPTPHRAGSIPQVTGVVRVNHVVDLPEAELSLLGISCLTPIVSAIGGPPSTVSD